ncbi:CO dehydrogenase/acetyl-CoA synthase complex subunit epsilon [Candidatus Thorarchaeota archaeon]|nr:MAG: CO dehydrogenase/acetyl-CoA synthase complex subunit epsilon [Candidatus Thorarchaeota archaeon]
MMRPVPWQTGEICGPESAKSLSKADVLKRDLKLCKKLLLIVGSEAATEKYGKGDMIDYAIALSKAGNMDVIATGGAIKAFVEKGFDRAKSMGAMEVAFRLQDPEWVGPFGKGPYDMIMIYGMPYYMQWTLLSAVMNFGTHITAISISRFFQPHAKWSVPNMKEKQYNALLEDILGLVGGGK